MSYTPSVQYLALLEFIAYGHTMYSLICAYTDNIYCNECNFIKLDRFTRFFGVDGIFSNTASTLKVPLLPVGMLLRPLSQATR